MDYHLQPVSDLSFSNSSTSSHDADLTLSFDVGHSSIGWAVLQSPTPESISSASSKHPNILGTGVVIFPADDCLASKRRDFRRQRRHVRSTRQRIQRLEKLLMHLGVFSADQIRLKHTQGGGTPAPWLLAARVLASNGASDYLLNWDQLWDVLRWYAHNRGYDGNRRWAGTEESAVADNKDDDTKKVENARVLMRQYNTQTMAETVTAIMFESHGKRKALDIPVNESLPFFNSLSRYKAKNAAFPRDIVENEVRALLFAHAGKLPKLTDFVIHLLFDELQCEEDKALLAAAGIRLPKRYEGGLLFGQFVPRFDNRIITTCPISGKKVPSKASKEFRLFRWLTQLANVRVIREGQNTLSASERATIHQKILNQGYFTPSQFKDAVRNITGTKADNLDAMLMHPDADKALVLDPVKKFIASKQVQSFWDYLPEPVRKRVTGKWVRGKTLTLQRILDWCPEFGVTPETILNNANAAAIANRKPTSRTKETNSIPSLSAALKVEPLNGRAPYHRDILKQACGEVLAGFDPRKKCIANDPVGGEEKEHDGILVRDPQTVAAPSAFPEFERWYLRWSKRKGNTGKSREKAQQEYFIAKQQSLHDSRTNNHLIRHRLLILQRLVNDIIADPTLVNGNANRIKAVAIEVNSEIKELSGKTAKEVAQELGHRLGNFKSVVKKLEDAGIHNPSPTLIRKARVAEDLNWTCPYTGQKFDFHDLLNPNVWDKDHIIPYSQRPSNSLDSLVITKKSINKLKANRTALEFIEWINRPENAAQRDQYQIWTPRQYKDFVANLESWKGHDDDKRRKRKRKQLLLLPEWEKKDSGFLPRDLTITSQLTRLAALALNRALPHLQPHHITSIPGSVTGVIRNGWRIHGALQAANPGVIDATTGELKTKTEIRDITHLHHALDAVVLGLAHHYFPRNGRLWEAIVRRDNQRGEEDNQLLLKTGLYLPHQYDNQIIVRLTHKVPDLIDEQLREKLAEQRVVQHIPADMSGIFIEENTRGLTRIDESGVAHLKQISRDSKTGKITLKRTTESVSKLIGLKPGKLKDQKGVRVITANYGVAILDVLPNKKDGSSGDEEDRFIIIPFAKVKERLQALAKINNGVCPKILRAGQLIEVTGGKFHKGIWRIFSVKNNSNGKALTLGEPNAVNFRKDKQNVLLRQLMKDGMTFLDTNLCGPGK